MTKLTEEILRAQTCPFVLKHRLAESEITVKYIGKEKLFYETPREEAGSYFEYIIENFKLPEPEPKPVEAWGLVIDGELFCVSLDRDFKDIKKRPTGFIKLEIIPLTETIKE